MARKRNKTAITSPVGWFAVTYIEHFVRPSAKERKATPCWVYENTILIKAHDASEAYDRCYKVMAHVCCGSFNEAYDESIKYERSFGGIVSMMPLCEKLGDFCEVSWCKYRTTVQKLSREIPDRDQLVYP